MIDVVAVFAVLVAIGVPIFVGSFLLMRRLGVFKVDPVAQKFSVRPTKSKSPAVVVHYLVTATSEISLSHATEVVLASASPEWDYFKSDRSATGDSSRVYSGPVAA